MGGPVSIRVTGPDAAALRVRPRLALADPVKRYPIDGPVDVEAARREAQEDAVRECVARLSR